MNLLNQLDVILVFVCLAGAPGCVHETYEVTRPRNCPEGSVAYEKHSPSGEVISRCRKIELDNLNDPGL